MGDLFEPVLELKQKLPDLKKLAAAAEKPETIEIAAEAEDSRRAPAKSTSKNVGKKPAVRKAHRKI
jgi:hypothetical protein